MKQLTIKEAIQETKPISDREAHLRKQIQVQSRQIESLREQLGAKQEFYDEVCAAVNTATPPKISIKKQGKNLKPATAVLLLGDWHIGERVKSSETHGMREYSYNIARSDMAEVVNSFIKWIDVQRCGYSISDCAVIGLGDWISGEIHEELMITNEFGLPQQIEKAGHLLGETITSISGNCSNVDFYSVMADNHGRRRKKPQSKNKAYDNYNYLVDMVVKGYVINCKNVTCHDSQSMQLLIDINGYKFLAEHGDAIPAYGTLPFYSFTKSIGKEALRRMNTSATFDYWVLGHFHCPFWLERMIVGNGSLTGVSEFAFGKRYGTKPSQVAFLVGSHGLFNLTEFSPSSAQNKKVVNCV